MSGLCWRFFFFFHPLCFLSYERTNEMLIFLPFFAAGPVEQKVIPASVVKPKYQRPGDGRFIDHYMCHMGVGGFHRCAKVPDFFLVLVLVEKCRLVEWCSGGNTVSK